MEANAEVKELLSRTIIGGGWLQRTNSEDGQTGHTLRERKGCTVPLRRTSSAGGGTADQERANKAVGASLGRRPTIRVTGSLSPTAFRKRVDEARAAVDDNEGGPVRTYVPGRMGDADDDGLDATPPPVVEAIPAMTAPSFGATFSGKLGVKETAASRLRSQVAAAMMVKSHAAGIEGGKVFPFAMRFCHPPPAADGPVAQRLRSSSASQEFGLLNGEL